MTKDGRIIERDDFFEEYNRRSNWGYITIDDKKVAVLREYTKINRFTQNIIRIIINALIKTQAKLYLKK